MQYSNKIKSLLKKNKIEIMHNIILKLKDGREFKGIIMPRGQGNPDSLVIKLATGYNVGFLVNNIKHLESKGKIKVHKFKPSKTEDDKTKPLVHIACAGGTIASRVEYRTGAVYPMVSSSELLSVFPELSGIAQVKCSEIISILSEDMTPVLWQDIAKHLSKIIKKDKPKGIVLTHGTDTMHYTAAALSFFLQNLSCPIVLTGAQRSADRGSSDAKDNLLSSVTAITGHNFNEVTVCMHATMSDNVCLVHRGNRVRKMHSSRRDTFKTINGKPLFEVDWKKGKVIQMSALLPHNKAKKLSIDTKLNDNVCMQYVYPGLKPRHVSKLSDYDGIVLIGTGLGHVSTNAFDNKKVKPILKEIKALVQSNIPVVMSSQTIFGRINMNVYTAGRQLMQAGVIGHLCDWTPETAYVKLMWVLGHKKKMNDIRQIMEQNIAGEISNNSKIIKKIM